MLFKTFFALAFASLVLAQTEDDDVARQNGGQNNGGSSCRATTSTRTNTRTPTVYITRCATSTVQGPRVTTTTTFTTTLRRATTTRTSTVTLPRATTTRTVTVTSTSTVSPASPTLITVVGFEANECQNGATNDGDRTRVGIVQVPYTPRGRGNNQNGCVNFSDRTIQSLEYDYANSTLFDNDDCDLVLYRSFNCDINSRVTTLDLDPNDREVCRDTFQSTVRSLRVECPRD